MNYASESPPNDEKDRPFICPCGKSYLSYPALFTHIKQKHDGKAPGNVVRPKSQNKRGRPRKTPYAGINDDEQNQQTQFKSFTCRYVLNNQQQKQLGFLINQVQSAKDRSKGNFDFVPPITTSHIAMILAPNNQLHQLTQNCASENILKKKLRQILQPLKKQHNYASSTQIQKMIGLNKPYLYSLEEQRKSSRRPIGCDLWEMEFRTALLQFLDYFKDYLTRNQFRNVEIIISLLIYFYNKQVGDNKEFTTANYVQYLNTFVSKFLTELSSKQGYDNIFSLNSKTSIKILLIIHQWMMEEGLTDFVVRLNESNQGDHEKQLVIEKDEQNSI